jgi:ABC-type Fe3+ transport system substrate-binding protein
MAYTIRKLPFTVASSQSALSFIARELIEVAQVHGASLWQVWRLIVFPLIWRPIFGGAILTFAFSMLEVSDSLILAREEKFYPIAKAIYALALRPDGPAPACAFGFMLGVVLTVLILWSHKLSKRSLTLITTLVTLCLPTYLVAEKNSNIQEELIILSPHWDGLKYEITQAFNEYTENSVKIRWLDVGGTSDILRFVEGEQQHIPRADVLFGGGTATFRQLAAEGFLMKVPLATEIRNAIADNLHGTQLHDQNSFWYSAMLTGFGILCNTLTLKKLDLSLPSSWADLSKPEWHSWISLADPRKSGSAHVIIELILQKHGWNNGWKILQRIRRNISIITSSSSELPWLIATGEVACGGVVDSYASHAKSYADTNLIFIMPSEETSILGDPIGVLNNAPHPIAAIKFLNFILSNKFQKLLMSRKGASDGPKKYELYHMSVIPSLYDSLGQQKTDIGNPFSWQPTHNYSDSIARSRWHILNDLVGIYLIDAPLKTISVSEPPISEEELAILTQNKSWLTSLERQEFLFNWREILWSKH